MAQSLVQSLPQDKFLLVAVNLLHKAFIEPTRTQAKTLYQQIAAGTTVNLTRVQLEDKSTAAFQLSLSHSEFKGRINFGAFRASVKMLIANIAQALREEREIRVFSALNGGSATIFGITGVTLEDGQHNVMVLAVDAREDEATTVLQLMYLDPAQFTEAATAPQSEGVS